MLVFFQNLLQLKKRCDAFAQFSFDKDPAFEALVHTSIGRTIASYQCDIQVLLLNSIDEQLLRSTKPVDPSDVHRIGDLLSFLPDRSSFEVACKRLLARRVLTGRTYMRNLDAFSLLLKRMEKNRKSTGGYEGTSGLLDLGRMVDDVETSKASMSEFHASQTYPDMNGEVSQTERSVLILRSGLWPVSSQIAYSLHLPLELGSFLENYSR